MGIVHETDERKQGGNGDQAATTATDHKALLKAGGTLRDLVIFETLLGYRNRTSGLAWPAQATVAREAGVSPRTVRAAYVKLRNLGWIEGRGWHRSGTELLGFPRLETGQSVCRQDLADPPRQDVADRTVKKIEPLTPLPPTPQPTRTKPQRGGGVGEPQREETPTRADAERVIQVYGRMMIPCGVANIKPAPVAKRLQGLAKTWDGYTPEAVCKAITTEANRLGRLGHSYRDCPRLLDLLARWAKDPPPAPVAVGKGVAQ